MGRPKKLLGITHATLRRDQKELEVRFVFDDRSPMVAIVSFDAVERMARVFAQLASGCSVGGSQTKSPGRAGNDRTKSSTS